MSTDYCSILPRCCLFINDTDTKIKIKYDRCVITLGPKCFSDYYWYYEDRFDVKLKVWKFPGLEEVELANPLADRPYLVDLRGISIYRDASDAHYSWRAISYQHIEHHRDSIPSWVSQLRWTALVNKTDSEIQIEYDGDVYMTLNPKSAASLGWFSDDGRGTLLSKIILRGAEWDHNISLIDFHANRVITIFKDISNAYSIQALSERKLKERVMETISSVKRSLLRMEVLLKKVKIWRNQCEHLLDNYRGRVEIIVEVLDGLRMEVNPAGRIIICSKILCCMLQGEALLLFCGGNDNYVKAAFALSSPPPPVPTFSRFALVLCELDWTVDFICSIEEYQYSGSEGYWEWCEKSSRLVNFLSRLKYMAVESLEADGSRQSGDRDDLQRSLKLKKTRFWTRNEFQNRLEGIWRKRLLPPLHAPKLDSVPFTPKPDLVPNSPGPDSVSGTPGRDPVPVTPGSDSGPDILKLDSVLDCFWIDNPEHFESGSQEQVVG